jgi:hypothetical protein
MMRKRGTAMRGLLVLLLCGGCVEWQVFEPLSSEVDAPEGADDAVELVVHEWADRLSVGMAAEDAPPVVWYQPDAQGCLVYEHTDECITGSYQRVVIHLAWSEHVRDSALAHELLHWALDMTAGDSDHDHAGPAWAQVDDVEESCWPLGVSGKGVMELAGL